MADDKVRVNAQSKCFHGNSFFLSSAIFILVIINSSIFLAFTIHQLRQIGDVERMLLEKRLRLENMRASCWNNNYSKKEKLLQVIDQLPKIDRKYDKLRENMRRRQTSSISSLFQDLVHAQEQLLMQRCTPDTVICIKGQKGDLGFPGEKGNMGPDGSKGLPGIKGLDGQDGSPGEKGQKGIPGDKGLQGPQNGNGTKGDMGVVGDKGVPGLMGIKGDRGQTGVKGTSGGKGQSGSKGLPGVIGPKGDKGDSGPVGEQGAKGERGAVGAKGSIGNGTSCDCMDKPKFKESHQTESVHFGSNVTLDCSTTSLPEPTVTWIKTDSDGCFANFSKTSGEKIELKNIQPVDVGTYQCTAENAVGTSVKTITITSTDNPDVISCDFESGFCGWSQSKADDADFSRNTGILRTPTADHTPGKGGGGNYANIDSSAMTTGQKGKLESFFIPAQEKHCLTFWYYVDSASGAILKVKTKACSLDEATLLKLTSSGTGWKQARVDIPVDTHGRQIIFEAERGNSASDVAIDDVSFSNKECPPADKKPEIINKNQTIVVQKGDRAVLPCNVTGFPGPSFTWDKASACSTYQRNGQPLVITNASLSSAGTYKCIAKNRAGTDWGEIKLIVNETEICTFKSTEQCNWKNIQTGDNLDWVKQTGSTPSSQTGPSADHTNPNNGGYYMYMEASSPAATSNTAVLQYKTLPAGQPFCVHFWYHMFGNSMGSLRILAKDCKTNASVEIWKVSGDQGDKWNEACVLLEQGGHDYIPQIEAMRGQSYHSDIGIDDIEFRTGQCDCHTRIPVNLTCNFDGDICDGQGFRAQSSTTYQLRWSRAKGVTPSIGTGPDRDHTSGAGSYIFVETSGGSPGLKGSFISPQLPSNQEACLHFWYNMNGAEMGDLDVIVQPTTGNGTTILHESGNKGTRWFEAKMTIPSQTQPYKIDFQVTRGSGFKGDAALDDISIKDGPCV